MNVPPERDSSGRFLKPERDEPKPNDDDMHPMSKLLFGWVGSPRTPFIVLLLVVLICAGLVVFDLSLNKSSYTFLILSNKSCFKVPIHRRVI